MKKWLLLIFLAASLACRPTPVPFTKTIQKTALAEQAMIAAAHPLAVEAGLEILKAGGNAVDAAIAVQFALAVVYPRAGNLGGGGFMILTTADQQRDALDFREKAPLAASKNMYLDSLGEVIPNLSLKGHLAVGVPGTVAGLQAAHKKYGQSDFGTLLQPAIELAERGFRISKAEAERLNMYQPDFQAFSAAGHPFLKTAPWKTGDLLRQPDLANTLRRLQEHGPEDFYKGEIARQIVQEMQANHGLISMEDLQQYEPAWRTPISGNYGSYQIYSMPPPSSGGITLVQMLKMLEIQGLPTAATPQDPSYMHLLLESMRRAYRDRAIYLGDSDFVQVPLPKLLDSNYLSEKIRTFDTSQAFPSDSLLPNFTVLKESFETTHTSVVDAQGNAVALTTTLNSNYGSKVWVPGAGFFLNNEMDDFTAKPWTPNQFGLVGTEANAIAPGKRMLSSMTPTIIFKDGELFLVLGSPGGSTIITAILQVFLNASFFEMPLDSAVALPRIHHQWLPNEVWFETGGLSPALQDSLRKRGHRLVEKEALGRVKAIQRLPDGRLQGAGDPRQMDDHAAGY